MSFQCLTSYCPVSLIFLGKFLINLYYFCSFLVYTEYFFFSFFFVYAYRIWKFPGQGLNPCHSSHPSHCTVNAGYLTYCATGELLESSLKFANMIVPLWEFKIFQWIYITRKLQSRLVCMLYKPCHFTVSTYLFRFLFIIHLTWR